MNTGKLAGWMAGVMAFAGVAAAQSTEGIPTALESAPFHDDATGPDAVQGGGNYGYLRIAGSSFVPRNAAQPAGYVSGGCIQAGAAGALYAADVQLPAGADVRYVRTYYYNNGLSSSISTFFTEFDGAGDFTQHTTFPTGSNTGYASELSPAIAVTINPADRSYIMLVNIGTADPNLRFCGVRIQYFY